MSNSQKHQFAFLQLSQRYVPFSDEIVLCRTVKRRSAVKETPGRAGEVLKDEIASVCLTLWWEVGL